MSRKYRYSAREAAVTVMSRLSSKASRKINISDEISALVEDDKEKALANEIVKGTLRHIVSIDHEIGARSKLPLKKLKPVILNTLRISLYQIRYMDRIPVSAVCNEGVKIVNKYTGNSLGGYANGIIRKAAEEGETVPSDSCEARAVKYEIPLWMIRKWEQDYGEGTAERILEGFMSRPEDFVRVNPIKTTAEYLLNAYSGCFAEENEYSLKYIKKGSITDVKGFSEGLYHFQNLSSQLACDIVSPFPGANVLDACSSPGGKAFTMAGIMRNEGRITALDVSEEKVSRIRAGAERLGIGIISAFKADASRFSSNERYDIVLCDVPCSGLGLVRKKPEIILKTSEEIRALPEIQLAILKNCADLVAKEGRLYYTTCTLNEDENNNIIEMFLNERNDFVSVDLEENRIENSYYKNGTLTVLPDGRYEGFFIAAMRRKS